MRYSSKPFPPYRFLPGVNPHPTESPQGHSYGKPETAAALLNLNHWRENETYLYGVDLYNHQYWWESHEAWESLWKVSPDQLTKDFLQGLIKVSAAFMKWQSKNPRGLKIHYDSAMEHLRKVSVTDPIYMGIDLRAHILKLEKTFSLVLNAAVEQWPSPVDQYPMIILQRGKE